MASSKVRREFWERVVSEQRVSGLSGRAWCVQNGVALAAFYAWRKKFGSMNEPDVKRLRELEKENARLKKLLADRTLEIDVMKEFLEKK